MYHFKATKHTEQHDLQKQEANYIPKAGTEKYLQIHEKYYNNNEKMHLTLQNIKKDHNYYASRTKAVKRDI